MAIACWLTGWIHLFFLCVPVWLLTAALYIVLAKLAGAGEKLPDLPQSPTKGLSEEPLPSPRLRGEGSGVRGFRIGAPPAGPPRTPRATDAGPRCAGWSPGWFYGSAVVSLVALAACLALPLWGLSGGIGFEWVRWLLVWVTLVYFVSGTIWIGQRERRRRRSSPALMDSDGQTG